MRQRRHRRRARHKSGGQSALGWTLASLAVLAVLSGLVALSWPSFDTPSATSSPVATTGRDEDSGDTDGRHDSQSQIAGTSQDGGGPVPNFGPESRTGRASVIDGDTIEIAGERIRFNGIDAPEAAQTCLDERGQVYGCGAASAEFLDDLLATSRPVTCAFVEWDQYRRFVGNCYLADGRSVNSSLVRAGHAVDWPRYSNGAYSQDQEAAESEKKGLWRGPFVMPWNHRTGVRLTEPRMFVPLISDIGTGACQIKGNISSDGERIYHLPDQMHYSRTKISPSKGERWFCSESEAQAAGWRKAMR